MAQQPKNNIGNVMIITPKREKTKKTTHRSLSANNSVNKDGNSVHKLLKNYWGSPSKAVYRVFSIKDDILKYCPNDSPTGYGMMAFVVSEADLNGKNVGSIHTEAFDEAKLTEFAGNTTYRFVLEGQYLWRQDGSDFSADGFGRIRDTEGGTTHILATFGQADRGGDTWRYLILRAGNVKNGKAAVIEDYIGGGGDPPGTGIGVPPTD
jgi:hypothetical protein